MITPVSPKPSPIQREIKQTRPFTSRAQEGAIALLRTADVLRRKGEAVLLPHGITGQQYNVLRILRGAQPERLPTLEIAERMIERAPGITRLLDRLEAKGLVHRERCREDRRQVLCSITPAGLALLKKLDDPVITADRKRLGKLKDAELDQLIQLLDAIREGEA